VIGRLGAPRRQYGFVHLTFGSARARRLLEGSPRALLENDQVDEQAPHPRGND
jgi:hypothetical protein